MNNEESVADPINIQDNEEYMFNRVKSLSCKYLNMTLILIKDLIIFYMHKLSSFQFLK
jgi:hypothetical protein